MTNYQTQLAEDRKQVRQFIDAHLPNGDSMVEKAVRYSVFPTADWTPHFWRPLLLMHTADSYGAERELVLPYASAMELIHVAELVLDDLPSMDNSPLRRGKESCHTKFNVAIAEMASHYLVTLGQELIMSGRAGATTNQLVLRNVSSSLKDTIRGQELDLYETQDMNLDQMLNLYRLKTGTFFSLATTTGNIVANGLSSDIARLREFSHNAGIAYQLKDDMLDVIGDSKIEGKPLNQDTRKKTPITILGIERVDALREDYVEKAKRNLKDIKFTADRLSSLVNVLLT